MNIFSSDTNFSDDGNETNRYDEGSKSLPSENKTLKPIKEKQAIKTPSKSTEISRDMEENVRVKVEGVSNIEYDNDNIKDTISKNHLANNAAVKEDIFDSDNSINDSNVNENTDKPETLVRDLESRSYLI